MDNYSKRNLKDTRGLKVPLDWGEIIIGVFGMVSVLSTSLLGYLRVKVEKRKTAQAEQEMRFQRAALKFPDFVEEWDEISKAIVDLMSSTCLDRFMILRAWNGHLEPRWTTAVYQIRDSAQEPVSYIHFELDDDYIIKLRELMKTQQIYIDTSNIDNSEIKSVYNVEGITAALWVHLSTYELVGTDSKAITYCSFATHSDARLDANTQTKCRMVASRLRGLAESFEERS